MATGDECNNTRKDGLWAKLPVDAGITDIVGEWSHRRHLGKVHELGQAFASVFGEGSLLTQVRPVYAHWGECLERTVNRATPDASLTASILHSHRPRRVQPLAELVCADLRPA